MDLADPVYVAGHRGLVGSAIMRRLQKDGYTNIIVRTHAELDLTDQRAVQSFFQEQKPEYVFLAAAKVGGILANNSYPAEFIHQNLAIQTNVIHEAWRAGVKRLLFLGSSCIYPRDCPQPIKEEYLLTGPLEPTNRPYALAKIAGIEMCWSYNRQYGTQYLCAMPTNLYGPGDNYDLETSHVIPALLRKVQEAKERGDKEVVVWGTGKPRREFLHSDDLASAALHLMTLPKASTQEMFGDRSHPPLINVGTGSDVTISELAALIAEMVGFKGALVFDQSKPDGTPRKLLDVTQLHALGWKPQISLGQGIVSASAEFISNSRSSALPV
jgi:GDP-L-fucose synthase